MTKLFAFGDSHIAGHELGIDKKIIDDFYKKSGYSSAAKIKKLPIKKQTQVIYKWYAIMEQVCGANSYHTPSLAYAGKLADAIGYELVCRAFPGNSIHKQILLLHEENSIDWDNDIVMFGIPPRQRWLTNNEKDATPHNIGEKNAKILYNHGPGDKAEKLNFLGTLCYLRQKFPKIILVRQYDDIAFEQFPINNIFVNNISLQNMAGMNMNPAGHFVEEEHKKFASYLKICIDKKLKV